jgi:hypothetical protein
MYLLTELQKLHTKRETVTVKLNGKEKTVKVNREFDVPYLAGISNDENTLYIDKDMPEEIEIGNKTVNYAKYIALHELIEKHLMEQQKLKYGKAHDIAKQYEFNWVKKDDIDVDSYKMAFNGYITKVRHKEDVKAPSDIYEKPYADLNEKHILNKE